MVRAGGGGFVGWVIGGRGRFVGFLVVVVIAAGFFDVVVIVAGFLDVVVIVAGFFDVVVITAGFLDVVIVVVSVVVRPGLGGSVNLTS